MSGAHLNPAVSIAFAAFRDFPWRKVVPYSLAQLLGAFLASAVVYVTYREALDAFDHGLRAVSGPTATAGIWATYRNRTCRSPAASSIKSSAPRCSSWGSSRSSTPRTPTSPTTWCRSPRARSSLAIGATFGMNSGYAINPARDFGPRLFTAIAGWGGEVFRAGNGWWWVPLVATPIGALLGGFLYDLCITRLRPADRPSPAA